MKVAKARKGWGKRGPTKTSARRKLIAKCGARCFLMPKTLAFPICQSLKTSRGKCVVSCQGLRSAFARARQTKRPAVARKAVKRACKSGCKWTAAKERCPV